MSDQTETARASNDADLGRSQLIFVMVGITIILGGLYFLYQNSGPYHPEAPFPAGEAQGAYGS